MVAILAGSLLGLVGGGVLATFNWRYIFLVSVPIGIFGTAWSYLKLKESGTIRRNQKLDIWGNILFGGALTLILLGVSYGLIPYGSASMGWGNPWVIASLVTGAAMIVMFPFIERRISNPMFRLELFKSRAFTAGNFAGFLSSIGRGGVQIMLIILLQGIWLPLHGYSYESTPFWSGIYITPMLLGFVIMGPISGRISDRRGARGLATAGMVITAASFLLLSLLPYNFEFWQFALILLVMGIGGGLFGSPNTVSVMNSVPPEHRGAASGMRATLQNLGTTVSTAIFFTIVISALSGSLPSALAGAVAGAGAPQLAPVFKSIPPTGAMFAAFLGYNPVGSILSALPAQLVNSIPVVTRTYLTSTVFFPNAIAPAFMSALQQAFYIGVGLSVVAAVASFLRVSSKPPVEKEAVKEVGVISVRIPARTQAGETESGKGSEHRETVK
jgi:MFS family permease